jgi:hypothetical protein
MYSNQKSLTGKSLGRTRRASRGMCQGAVVPRWRGLGLGDGVTALAVLDFGATRYAHLTVVRVIVITVLIHSEPRLGILKGGWSRDAHGGTWRHSSHNSHQSSKLGLAAAEATFVPSMARLAHRGGGGPRAIDRPRAEALRPELQGTSR